jgi:dolichyl-phosphate beta-glucosyltransferase
VNPDSTGFDERDIMTQASLDLAVVIPAFNEASLISTSLEQLAAFLQRWDWTWEICVVDDGSLDGTRGAVAAFSRTEPRVRLQAEPHRGKGGAVRAGMLGTDAAFRFLCDADLSMPVHELARFLPPAVDGYDVVIGSREGSGARRVGEPWRRHLAGRLFNAAVRWMALPGIHDTQCGFKLFTARAADAIFPLVTIEGWAFDIEVLAIARRQGLRILQVPIEWHYREASRLRLLPDGARMLRDLRAIRAATRGGAHDRR